MPGLEGKEVAAVVTFCPTVKSAFSRNVSQRPAQLTALARWSFLVSTANNFVVTYFPLVFPMGVKMKGLPLPELHAARSQLRLTADAGFLLKIQQDLSFSSVHAWLLGPVSQIENGHFSTLSLGSAQRGAIN